MHWWLRCQSGSHSQVTLQPSPWCPARKPMATSGILGHRGEAKGQLPGQNFMKETDHCPNTRRECALWWSSRAKETAGYQEARGRTRGVLVCMCLSVRMHRYRETEVCTHLYLGAPFQGLIGGSSAALMCWQKPRQVFGSFEVCPFTRPWPSVPHFAPRGLLEHRGLWAGQRTVTSGVLGCAKALL